MRYYRLFKNIRNWWLHFAVKFGVVHRESLIFKLNNGVKIEVPLRLLHEFKEIFMEECYTVGLARKIPENPTIVDIGANIGLFSFFAASRYKNPRILSFEPIPANYEQLGKNISLNNHIDIEAVPCAIHGESDTITIYYDARDSFTTSATIRSDAGGGGDRIEVSCLTLPEIFDKYEINRCDLLKLDSEGSEFSTLYHCPPEYLRKIDQMAVEVHSDQTPGHNVETLSGFLTEIGFETRRKGGRKGMLYVRRIAGDRI